MSAGHIRHTKAFPKSRQDAAMDESGVKIRYYDDVDNAIRRTREGEGLHVDGLRGLAGSRKEIRELVDRLHAKGAWAIDTSTGRRSDGKHGLALLDEAVAAIANERRGNRRGAEFAGRAGGIESGKRKAIGRMPFDQIATFWFDKRLTNDQVMERVNSDPRYPTEISYTTIYRKLEKRNALIGRRSVNV